MSILYKALEKAEKIKAARASGSGSTGASLSSSPRPPARRRGRMVLRLIGLYLILMLAGSALAMVFFKDDVEFLLMEALGGNPPAARPAMVYTPDEDDDEAEDAQVEEDDGGEALVAALPPSELPPSELPPVPSDTPEAAGATGTPLHPQGTTNIAELMAEARAARAPEIASPSMAPSPQEAPPPQGQGGAQDQGGEEPPREPPSPLSAEQAVAQELRRSEAAALRPTATVESAAGRSSLLPELAGIAVTANQTETRETIATAYRSLLRGDYHTALNTYESILELDPQNLQALLGRATALHKLRRLEDAESAYERVLGMDPGNQQALTNVLAIIAEGSPREALARLRDLERSAPTFSPVAAQLGLVYGRIGMTEAAIASMSRAVALEPTNLLYRYNLAILLDHSGQAQDAAAAYQHVLEGLMAGGDIGVSADQLRARLRYLRGL